MTDAPKTVWITTRALDGGIVRGQVIEDMGGGRLSVKCDDTYAGTPVFHDFEYHLTREAAVTRATQMRDAKLRSLEAQAERLRGMVI